MHIENCYPCIVPAKCSNAQGDDPETYGVSKISGRKVTLAAPGATGSTH